MLENVKLYDVVRCGGYNWYVIDIEGYEVTLLAKDDVFGKSKFNDEDSNSYVGSLISSKLNDYFGDSLVAELRKKGVKPLHTYLSDIEYGAKVWLLSENEAKKLPCNIKWFGREGGAWWLRTPCEDPFRATVIHTGWNVDPSEELLEVNVGQEVQVRPAMRVHTEDLD